MEKREIEKKLMVLKNAMSYGYNSDLEFEYNFWLKKLIELEAK